MPSILPVHPNIKRQLKARLLDLSPRAFEFFAGELLVYVGLDRVQVTRYIGDGGIDAHGELVAGSGIVRSLLFWRCPDPKNWLFCKAVCCDQRTRFYPADSI
jgi:hypothetical protein